MANTKAITEKIYEDEGFVAFVMGVNGPKAFGTGETESEAWDACKEGCGPLDVANIQIRRNITCTLPKLGECWNNTALRLNEQGYDWEFASDHPEEWPTGAIGYYANIYTGNPAIFITGLDSEGCWADPDNNGEPICLECIREEGRASVEGEDDPEDFIDAGDYENGTEDYKQALANFQFAYKKLATPGQCWSCLQMVRESAE